MGHLVLKDPLNTEGKKAHGGGRHVRLKGLQLQPESPQSRLKLSEAQQEHMWICIQYVYSVYIYIYIHICVYTYMCIYIYVCIVRAYIYIYTDIHCAQDPSIHWTMDSAEAPRMPKNTLELLSGSPSLSLATAAVCLGWEPSTEVAQRGSKNAQIWGMVGVYKPGSRSRSRSRNWNHGFG